MKNLLTLLLFFLTTAFSLPGTIMATEYLISEQVLRDNLKISKICSDNKLFIVAESSSKFIGIKTGGLGVGLGITQVLEEVDGQLVPVICD